jgi:hypothetical protein
MHEYQEVTASCLALGKMVKWCEIIDGSSV